MAPRRRTLALSWTAVGGGRRHDEADVATVVRFAKRTKVVPTAWCTRSIHPFVNAFMGKDVSKSTWRRDPTSRRPSPSARVGFRRHECDIYLCKLKLIHPQADSFTGEVKTRGSHPTYGSGPKVR